MATALLVQSWIRASVSAYPSRSAIGREVSTIAVARIRARRRAGFLLELLLILWITIMSGGATQPWIRAASRPTHSWASQQSWRMNGGAKTKEK